MVGPKQVEARRRNSDLPFEIYASTVDALFEVPLSLFVGSLAASAAALIAAWVANSFVLLGFGLAIAATAWVRDIDMRAYHRSRAATLKSREAIQRWEHRYIVGAALYLALLGAWTCASFIVTDDPFVRMASLATTVAYLVGTSGRNFSSERLVLSQIAGAGIPLSAAMIVGGGNYLFILAIILLPLFYAVRLNATRMRRTLLDAVVATHDISLLAKQFNTALNNMPHGLCMFDADRTLLVANRRLSQLLSLPTELDLGGMTARELLVQSVGSGKAPNLDVERFISDFEAHLAGLSGSIFVEIRDGQTLAMTAQGMESGGSVVIVEDITERINAEARIHHLAHYDALTDLPNRTYFHDELETNLANMRRNGPAAVLFVDLDQFKQVNDTLGHPLGDELLREVANRLRGAISRSDVVARFGGDEFVVLHSPIRSSAEASDLAHRIIERLSAPYEIDSHHVVIGASIGIAMAPRDGIDADLLLKNADMALYHAKGQGRGVWRFFEPEMDARAQARRALELDLRRALAEEEFELAFQPLFNLRTMRITTCEALIRWRHPERGLISPMEFIPVAEDMGLIVEIGDWALRQACLECKRWPSDVKVAVNLSPMQFRRENLPRAVLEALDKTKLAPGRLEVEITESVLLQDLPKAREILEGLAAAGVRISLDDFGTGYSGLSYLHSFPLHKVKIDRSFVVGLTGNSRSLTLLRGVADLSASLGMTVTVEGIETEEQLAMIAAEKSIDEAQGYLFSVPIPARQIRDLLSSASPQWSSPQKSAGERRFGAA